MRPLPLSALLVSAALLVPGCGSTRRDATLELDFTPNAVHAGIYAALAHHFDVDQGIKLRVLVPSATTDSIKLLEAGRVRFAILDIHDLAIARERGAPVVGIMALVQRPLAAVIAAPEVRTPRQLVARTVGVTGVPSDTAVLRSVVTGAGGNAAKVKTITIGFNAVADLLAGRVAAATAFWSDEGVTLDQRRPGFHSFRVDQYGAPSYPELVVCATTATIKHDRPLAQSLVRALEDGYAFTLSHAQESAAELEKRVAGLDPKLVRAELTALLPAFQPVGRLDVEKLNAWAAWETRFGIVSRPLQTKAMFDPSIPAGAR